MIEPVSLALVVSLCALTGLGAGTRAMGRWRYRLCLRNIERMEAELGWREAPALAIPRLARPGVSASARWQAGVAGAAPGTQRQPVPRVTVTERRRGQVYASRFQGFEDWRGRPCDQFGKPI